MSDEEDILNSILAFKASTDGNIKRNASSLEVVCRPLLNFLKQSKLTTAAFGNGDTGGLFSSATNVAREILLPFSTKRLLYVINGPDPYDYGAHGELGIYFEIISESLSVLLVDGNKVQGLTQSAMLKMAPYASRFASSQLNMNASRAMKHMVSVPLKPSLDFCCKLLLSVDESLTKMLPKDQTKYCVETTTGNNSLQLPSLQESIPEPLCEIIESSLLLFYNVQCSVNPKKVFQILTCGDPDILPVLSRMKKFAEPQVKKILFEGLFHVDHHIDGYKSAFLALEHGDVNVPLDGKKPSKKMRGNGKSNNIFCYQENLFIALKRLFQARTKVDIQNAKCTASLLPILFEGYIVFSKKLRSERNLPQDLNTKKRKRTEDLHSQQFLFWKWIQHDAIVCLSTPNIDPKLQVEIIVSLNKMLHLLIKSEIYTPSNDEASDKMFSDLEAVAAAVIKSVQVEDENNDCAMKELLHQEISAIGALLELNHRLLHNQLGQVIHIINHHHTWVPEMANNLLVTIISTYTKLRQLNHFFVSFYEYIEHYRPTSSIFDETNIRNVNAVTMAVQNCPSAQISELWNICCSNFFRSSNAKVHDNIESSGVDLFTIFLRSILVDVSNSSSIQSLCLECWKEQLSKNFAEDGDLSSPSIILHASVTRPLRIASCLVELHTKCAFFAANNVSGFKTAGSSLLDDEQNAYDLSSFLSGFVAAASKNDSALQIKERLAPVFPSLQQLIIQRIRQLHSLLHIFEEDIMLNSDDVKGVTATGSLLREAQVLVDFCFSTVMKLNNEQLSSSWKLLAQNITIWGSYATQEHVRLFLRWMYTCGGTGEEKFKLSLLQDASFFEALKISLDSLDTCEDIIAGCTLKALASLSSERKKKSAHLRSQLCLCGVELICSSDQGATPLDAAMLSAILNATKEDIKTAWEQNGIYSKPKLDTVQNILNQICHTLMLMNSMPTKYFREDVDDLTSYANLIDMAFRLDAITRMICSFENTRSSKNTSFKILSLCRSIMARGFQELSNCGHAYASLDDKHYTSSIVVGLFESTKRILLSSANDTDGSYVRHLLSTTSELVEEMTMYCFSTRCIFDAFVSGLCNLLQRNSDHASSSSAQLLCLFVRAPLRKLLMQGNGKVENLAASSQSSISKLMLCMICELDYESSHEESLISERILALSDLFRFVVVCNSSNSEQTEVMESDFLLIKSKLASLTGPYFTRITDFLVKKVLLFEDENKIVSNLHSTHSAACYFLASLFAGSGVKLAFEETVPDVNVVERVMDLLMVNYLVFRRKIPLLSAAFTSLILGFSSDHLHDVVTHLMKIRETEPRQENMGRYELLLASKLHYYSLMIQVTKGQVNRDTVAAAAPEMIRKSMGLLSSKSQYEENILCALSFLNILIAKKDIYLLNGREIAKILSRVNVLFGSSSKSFGVDIFAECCLILSSFLKHYPTQIYAAAPSFSSALRTLLCQVIDTSEATAANDIVQMKLKKAQQLMRLCEVLPNHKDVFKKHVIGLILAFARSLASGSMSATLKKITIGICYALLDVCAEFEIQQLNCMMDLTTKAIFRSVFQSYHKSHKYHGQF